MEQKWIEEKILNDLDSFFGNFSLSLDRRAYVEDGKLVGPKHREHRTIWISGNGFQETAQHSVFQGLGTHAE